MLYDPSPGTGREVWETIMHFLYTRCCHYCEARTPACLAPDLTKIPRSKVSVHHRVPRKMGGTTDRNVNGLSRIMLICGTGTSGCHGWIESNRDEARGNGWLVPRLGTGEVDAEAVPLVIPDRPGKVYLTDLAPVYLTAVERARLFTVPL